MKPPPKPTDPPPGRDDHAPDCYGGFSLRSVTWGYRDVFARTIDELMSAGWLGPERREVTTRFFELMGRADQGCFDHVLRQFLAALNPANRWIMDLPGVFADVTDLGGSLASSRLHYGMRFFETLAAGGMGDSPAALRRCIRWVRRLREVDDELAMAFLAGYARLSERLRPREMERYVDVALDIHRRNPRSARAFLRGELSSSETYILSLTRECRLCDVSDELGALILALTGTDCHVADLGELDSDELIERGTRTLALREHLYLPGRFRHFDDAELNRKWYLLCGVAAAAMLLGEAFPAVHGHERYRSCTDLVGSDVRRVNLFSLLECTRALAGAKRRWSGASRLIDWGLQTELDELGDPDNPWRLLGEALDESEHAPAADALRREAGRCVNCFDAAERLDGDWARAVLEAYPQLAARPLAPSAFLSDFRFAVDYANPPADRVIADMTDAARGAGASDGADSAAGGDDAAPDRQGKSDAEPGAHEAAYLYDEWDFEQNAYREAWCHVHPTRAPAGRATDLPGDWQARAQRVRTVFERLKPELVRREKRLDEGDEVNVDRLLEHLIARRREPGPPARFYEKPLTARRDLAVLVLLDVSGSTGEQLGDRTKVLDVEKRAVVVLAEGLAALDDRFAVCGFSSNGREQCEYFTFKGFEDRWDDAAGDRVLSAWPRSSTRIGPALRHAGYLLGRQPHRQRLIVLVTDGKPMDQGYDPNRGYAQHDVRMACEENARRDVHTFAISTEVNSQADMEVMFPRRRFVILPSIRQLPRVLPQLYLRLTL